jgi:hypothetical protein
LGGAQQNGRRGVEADGLVPLLVADGMLCAQGKSEREERMSMASTLRMEMVEMRGEVRGEVLRRVARSLPWWRAAWWS